MFYLIDPRFNVIPCREKSKLPSIPWKEFQTKKNTTQVTSKNYAIICGKISNIFVVDIDSPEIIHELFTNFNAILDKTLVVKTGSGGYHVYFEYDTTVQTMRLDNPYKNQHIDIQSEGTYVIGPGSIHPDTDKEYEIISKVTTISKMANFSGFLQHIKSLGFNTEGSGLQPFHEIAKGKVSVGSRNASAFKYACNLLDNVNLDIDTTWIELKRWNNSISPPLSERELRTVYESAVKRTAPNIKSEPKTNDRLLRDISAKDEGVEISFNAFISALSELQTVTTEMTCSCDNGHENVTLPIKGNGYENPSVPKCPKCSYYMKTTNKKTNDIRIVLLQELQEEVKNNNIFRKEAKLIGDDALNAYISTRKIKFTGKLKSIPKTGKKENDIILFIKNTQILEDTKEEIPNDEEIKSIENIKSDNLLNSLCSSFAPDILGYTEIKKTILLHLVEGGNLRRKQIHLLLIGNPSKAKSELLKATNKLVTSSYINGKMASGAGLAYGMVKLPNGTSVAQVGPLGLNSFVQIDELDKMRLEDRGALLEVMEQQSISLTKAGINSSISAKPSIIAAANPKYSTWDNKLDILKNVNFESFLLTRFDLIIGLIKEDPVADGFIYDHIMKNALGEVKPVIDESLLIKYLNLCRTREPILTPQIGEKIVSFFKKIKHEITENNTEYIPIETRQLEGLIRLVTAHAKIYDKKTIDEDDVNSVIELFKYSLDSLRIKYEGSAYQSEIGERRMSKEQIFNHIITESKDQNGNINELEVVQKLARDKRFGNVDIARTYFNRMYERGILLQNTDGTLRESPHL